MKSLKLITLTVTLATLTAMCPHAYAEVAQGATQRVTAPAKIAHVAKRLAAKYRTYPFVVYFPWGRCRVNYRATTRNPKYIVGYMCGTYTVCTLRRAPNYICEY